MLTIWGRLNSHNVKKVAWLAHEIGLPHRRIDMGGAFGFTDEYLVMNPNRLIPSISVAGGEDDGLTLWESNAILRYLADRHAPHLWPEGLAARARADRWMDWQFQYADAQRPFFVNLVRRSPDERNPEAIAASAAKAGQLMSEVLEPELTRQPWLSGAAFGVADIPMGVYAHTFFTLPIARPALPAVEDWYARLRQRPGFAELVMIPLT